MAPVCFTKIYNSTYSFDRLASCRPSLPSAGEADPLRAPLALPRSLSPPPRRGTELRVPSLFWLGLQLSRPPPAAARLGAAAPSPSTTMPTESTPAATSGTFLRVAHRLLPPERNPPCRRLAVLFPVPVLRVRVRIFIFSSPAPPARCFSASLATSPISHKNFKVLSSQSSEHASTILRRV